MTQLFHPVLLLVPSDLTSLLSNLLFQAVGLSLLSFLKVATLTTHVSLGKVVALNPNILLSRLPNFIIFIFILFIYLFIIYLFLNIFMGV